jgi:hypothetical protein
MVLRLSKRAELDKDQVLMIMQLGLVLALFALVIIFVNQKADNTLFWKNYLARDNALVVESLHGAPGVVSFVYSYPRQDQAFILSLLKDRVKVTADTEAVYPFAQDSKVGIKEKDTESMVYSYTYDGSLISIGGQKPLCEKSMKSLNDMKFDVQLLPKLIKSSKNKFEVMQKSLEVVLESYGFVNTQKEGNEGLTANLRVYFAESTSNNVEIGYTGDPLESKSLGCEIYYTLQAGTISTGYMADIPTLPADVDPTDPSLTVIIVLVPKSQQDNQDIAKNMASIMRNHYQQAADQAQKTSTN